MERKKRAGYTLIIGIALVLLLASLIEKYKEKHSFHVLNDFSSGWVEVKENGSTHEITLPSKEVRVDARTYTMYRKLPKETASGFACFFKSENIFFHVYVDDQLISKYTKEDVKFGNTPGDRWNIILLPVGSAGKELRIETQIIYPTGSNFIRTMYVGKYDEIIKALLLKNIAGFIQCILLLVVSTLFILINERLIVSRV